MEQADVCINTFKNQVLNKLYYSICFKYTMTSQGSYINKYDVASATSHLSSLSGIHDILCY